MAPAISGNLFSLAFGRNLDAHASKPSARSLSTQHSVVESHLSARGGIPSELVCNLGRDCYIDSLKITTFACIAALGLSLFAVYRDRRRTKATRVRKEVVWDTDGNSIINEPLSDEESFRR